MSHVLATVLHRGRKAASNVMAACLAPRGRDVRKRECGGGSCFSLAPLPPRNRHATATLSHPWG